MCFSFLGFGDLYASKLVCKEWYSLLLERKLWNRFLVKMTMKGDIPDSRVCHSCVVFQDRMWIFGGHVPSEGPTFYINEVKNDMYQYQFGLRTWNRLEIGYQIPSRTEHSAVVYQDLMYIFGGYGSGEGYTNTVYCYDPILNSATLIETTGEAPLPRSAHSAVVYKDHMYIYGGWDSDFSRNDLFSFNFATKEWKNITYKGVSPPAVRSHCTVVYKDSMFVFGGYGEDKHPTDIYKYDFETQEWSIYFTYSKPPHGRSRSKAVVFGSKMYIFAGWNRTQYFSDFYEFDFESRIWQEVQVNLGQGLGQHSIITYENKLYVFGGFCASVQRPVNTMYANVLA